REKGFYVITERLGVIRFPRNLVEKGGFGSIREAYQYKLEQLPEHDPAELMKLARWCLSLKLSAEAKEQLTKLLELSPDHREAKAMLLKMEQSEALAARRQRDPEVLQTR